MAVSKLLAASGANDFNLNITGATTLANFDKEYASGSYSIVSSGNDATIDIYAYNSAGTLVGYTATKAFTASGGFNKMVILGGTSGDVLGFTFKKTITTTAATAEVTAGPAAVSVNTANLPNIDDTTVLTGNNFASDVTVKFTSANAAYPITSAKSVVRTDSTSLTITRPDNFPPDYSPYSLVLENPGITQPTGSNVHILSDVITSGTAPIWSTGATLPSYTYNSAYSTTVAASDTEASTMSYAINSGVLPTGLSLDSSTGVISGTPTVSVPQTFIVRVTDAGGNFVDRSFTLPNIGPTWVTPAALPNYINGVYSQTVTATDDVGVTYSIVAGSALPTGLSLNTASGLLSGTITAVTVTNTFTLRATDANGTFSDRAFTILIPYSTFVSGLISAGFSLVGGNYERSSSGQITLPAFPSAAVTIDLYGAGGGSGQRDTYGIGGAGGYGRASITAASYGQVMTAFIGGGGPANTGNVGGAGGGGTDLRRGGTAYGNREIVVGGGGGSGAPGGGTSRGGYGGGFNQDGGNGVPGANGNNQYGLGGTSSGGGSWAGSGTGVNGGFGYGGDQGYGQPGFNGGGRGRNTEAGGGGGGWYGGGGSGSGNWGGGGGGGSGVLNSTYFTAVTTTTGGGSAGGSSGSAGTDGKIVIILA
jgi:hypothetical protein